MGIWGLDICALYVEMLILFCLFFTLLVSQKFSSYHMHHLVTLCRITSQWDDILRWLGSKKKIPPQSLKVVYGGFHHCSESFISCLKRKRSNLTLFCEASSTWSLHEVLLWWFQTHAEPWAPSDLPCVQTQLRHFHGFLTVAWGCLSKPGWLPTLAWNQKDSIFTRMGSSRHFFRCISPWGLNCQNTFESVCCETSHQGLLWDQWGRILWGALGVLALLG